jgi:glycosyltransferase involved in cell wall biosynthesis
MTIPGKVQSYMAARKPFIGAINGSCANFIKNNETGYTCQSGDHEELGKLIKDLDLKQLRTISEHSKRVYFAKYSISIFINIEDLKINFLKKSADLKKTN